MQCQDVIEKLRELAPEYLACDWDNVGLLLGDEKKDVHKILIGLEINDSLIEQAIKNQVDFIVTHHPMLFHPVKRITMEDAVGRWILKMSEHGISYYAMHTNFDSAALGMAQIAAEKLGLEQLSSLEEGENCGDRDEKKQAVGIGRAGMLKKAVTLEELCIQIKQTFGNQMLIVYAAKEQMKTPLSRVAIVPGSGSDYVDAALKKQVQVLITGDITHHTGVDTKAKGLILIDAGHYRTEQIFIEFIEQYLHDFSERGIQIMTAPIEDLFQVV